MAIAFPSDIKGCMKDCILALLWPRRDIYNFFKDHGCTEDDLKNISNFKSAGMSRSEMVDRVFTDLSSDPTGGLGPFRAMLQSLTTWSRFDPYYFDDLRKLNRDKAEKCLDHLRQLQEIRDSKTKADRERRDENEQAKQQARKSRKELLQKFLCLSSGKVSHQERGYSLERILAELAGLAGLEVTEPFRVGGEQIDGAVKYDGEHYIVEAKWQEKAAANEPVYQFVNKVEGKMYGRGIFVSINGFSDNVVRDVVKGKAIKTIFVDGADLMMVLEERLSFAKMLDRKVKAAQTKGLIYVNPITGKPKVS